MRFPCYGELVEFFGESKNALFAACYLCDQGLNPKGLLWRLHMPISLKNHQQQTVWDLKSRELCLTTLVDYITHSTGSPHYEKTKEILCFVARKYRSMRWLRHELRDKDRLKRTHLGIKQPVKRVWSE